jgi:hypothetical protein
MGAQTHVTVLTLLAYKGLGIEMSISQSNMYILIWGVQLQWFITSFLQTYVAFVGTIFLYIIFKLATHDWTEASG